jgi:hypothetical protein
MTSPGTWPRPSTPCPGNNGGALADGGPADLGHCPDGERLRRGRPGGDLSHPRPGPSHRDGQARQEEPPAFCPLSGTTQPGEFFPLPPARRAGVPAAGRAGQVVSGVAPGSEAPGRGRGAGGTGGRAGRPAGGLRGDLRHPGGGPGLPGGNLPAGLPPAGLAVAAPYPGRLRAPAGAVPHVRPGAGGAPLFQHSPGRGALRRLPPGCPRAAAPFEPGGLKTFTPGPACTFRPSSAARAWPSSRPSCAITWGGI